MNPKSILGFLYGSTPAEFKSAFGLTESVERLRAATRRWAFGVLAEQAATGPVEESRVRLQRVIPMVGNSFKPLFFGRFEVRDGTVYLTGRFTMFIFVKVFMTVWLGGVLAIGMSLAATTINTQAWTSTLGVLGMFCAGLALIGFGKWLARNDIAWLSNVIRAALGEPAVVQVSDLSARTLSTPQTASSLPTVLRLTSLALLFAGAMGVASAALGISEYPSKGAKIIGRFSSWPPRLAIGAFGLCMLVTAVGVYRRKLWAWRLGLVLFGVSAVVTVEQAFSPSTLPENAGFRAIFCVLTLGVTAYWGWWWYAQRIHFPSDA